MLLRYGALTKEDFTLQNSYDKIYAMCIGLKGEGMKEIHTIFDLIIYAYIQLCKFPTEKYIKDYFNGKHSLKRTKLALSFEDMIYGNLSVEEFIEDWSNIFEQNNPLDWVHIMILFDKYYKDREKYNTLHKRQSRPLFIENVQSELYADWMFYPLEGDNLFVKNMKENQNENIRQHRIKQGIWLYIESYYINPKSEKCNVILWKYKNSCFEEQINEAHIFTLAFIPFSNVCKFECNADGLLQRIPYGDEQEDVVDSCIDMLRVLDDKAVDIVIFPETIMEKNIVDKISERLQDLSNGSLLQSIKYIFLGSYFETDSNCCTLMNGNGKILLTNKKRHAFSYKDNGQQYVENIEDEYADINLIDIKGLGRVWYLICKDALYDTENIDIVNYFNVNVEMVSAYSNSLSDFRKIAVYLAERYGVYFNVCNSCAKRPNKSIGFTAYPGFNKTKDLAWELIEYNCKENIVQCQYCKCAQIFVYDLKKIIGDGEKNLNYVECNSIMF